MRWQICTLCGHCVYWNSATILFCYWEYNIYEHHFDPNVLLHSPGTKQSFHSPFVTCWGSLCSRCQWAVLPCAGGVSEQWTRLSCPTWERRSAPVDWSDQDDVTLNSHLGPLCVCEWRERVCVCGGGGGGVYIIYTCTFKHTAYPDVNLFSWQGHALK